MFSTQTLSAFLILTELLNKITTPSTKILRVLASIKCLISIKYWVKVIIKYKVKILFRDLIWYQIIPGHLKQAKISRITSSRSSANTWDSLAAPCNSKTIMNSNKCNKASSWGFNKLNAIVSKDRWDITLLQSKRILSYCPRYKKSKFNNKWHLN